MQKALHPNIGCRAEVIIERMISSANVTNCAVMPTVMIAIAHRLGINIAVCNTA